MRYVRRKHQLVIGEATPSASRSRPARRWRAQRPRAEVHIRGRDLRQGHAKSAVLRARRHRRGARRARGGRWPSSSQRALEDLPPDIPSDIARRGVHLTGGGALLDQLDVALTQRIGVQFHVQQNPMHCVVKGTAAVLAGLADH